MARQVSVSKFQEMMAAEQETNGLAERMADRAERAINTMGSESTLRATQSDENDESGSGQRGRARGHGASTVVVDVAPDGIVEAVRPAEMTPDRGPEVGTTVHAVSDEEPRFSGAGAGWTSTNESDELPRTAPWMVLRVPTETEFGDDEFIASTALAHRAEILTERHPDLFDHIADLKVVYLWKKTGGKSKGKGVYGKTAKASGLVKHFSEHAVFVIWLAADHCRGAAYTERQLEALLFHEMCHTSVAEADSETGRGGGPTLVPHDVEMFRAEVEVYGLWDADLRDVAPAFRQGHLFDAEVQRSGSTVVADGAGVLIHEDGTALTDDEIEAMERRELADDDLVDGQAVDDQRPYADEEPEELQEQRPREPFTGEVADTDEITVVAGDEVGGPNDPDA